MQRQCLRELTNNTIPRQHGGEYLEIGLDIIVSDRSPFQAHLILHLPCKYFPFR